MKNGKRHKPFFYSGLDRLEEIVCQRTHVHHTIIVKANVYLSSMMSTDTKSTNSYKGDVDFIIGVLISALLLLLQTELCWQMSKVYTEELSLNWIKHFSAPPPSVGFSLCLITGSGILLDKTICQVWSKWHVIPFSTGSC